ncbi:MAG: hypothetical protein ACXIT9_00555 [Nitritalea sp.]
MKTTILSVGVSVLLLFACGKEMSVEERFVYEGNKIVDVETGDEYVMVDNEEVFVVTHEDGSKEEIPVDETPFYESVLTEDYISAWKADLAKQEEALLTEKKNMLRAARAERYASYDDDALLKAFQKAHKEEADLSRQLDLMGELIARGVVSEDEAPELLEIEEPILDFDIELEEPVEDPV